MCKIVGDHWEGVMNQEWVIENPSSVDLERAIERLDAQTYTMVTVQADEERHLTIGGGAGQYVVYATFDSEEFWNLVRPQEVAGTVLLNAGGQQGDFPAIQVVDKGQACAAGLAFLDTHQLDKQQWQKQ